MIGSTGTGGIVRLAHTRWLRRLAAVAIGPLVALQLLLAGIVSVQMAVEPPLDASVICYGAGRAADGDSDHGEGHARHVACAICVLAALVSPIPPRGAHLLLRDAFSYRLVEPPSPRVTTAAPHTPRSSQGPPRAA